VLAEKLVRMGNWIQGKEQTTIHPMKDCSRYSSATYKSAVAIGLSKDQTAIHKARPLETSTKVPMMITQREVCGCYETRSRGLPASERITSYKPTYRYRSANQERTMTLSWVSERASFTRFWGETDAKHVAGPHFQV
jgi:hypothetical protein